MALSSHEQFYEDLDLLPMYLNAFVKVYGSKLPQMIAVNKSIYGVCSGSLLSEGQILQVYFKKETKVVDVSLSSHNYVVPISSHLTASVLYNPHNNLEKAKEGYYFATVADLIKAVPQPFVVSVGKNWMSPKNSSQSLHKGQILIVSSVSKIEKKLYCINTESNTSLCLKDTCKGHFTTQPSLIAVDLRLLVEHLQLPIQVFFHHHDAKHYRWFDKEIGMIGKQYLLKSIIAAPKFSKRSQYNDVPSEILEIVASVPINVKIVQISEKVRTKLILESHILAKILKPSLVTEVITNVSQAMKSFQEEILKSLPEKEWINGIHYVNTGKYKMLSVAEVETSTKCTPSLNSSRNLSYATPIPLRQKRSCSLDFPSEDKDLKTIIDNPFYGHIQVSYDVVSDSDPTPKTVSAEDELLLQQLAELRKNNTEVTAHLQELEDSTINGNHKQYVITWNYKGF